MSKQYKRIVKQLDDPKEMERFLNNHPDWEIKTINALEYHNPIGEKENTIIVVLEKGL